MAFNYESVFRHLAKVVQPKRQDRREAKLNANWWRFGRPRVEMRNAIVGLARFLVTLAVSKHRIFSWLDSVTVPDQQLLVFATAADEFLGILQSRAHEVWALSQGTQVRERESGFRYTPTTCFETFPFPEPTAAQRDAIAAAAKELNTLRTAWLNPPEWTREEILTFPGSVDGPWSQYVTEPNSKGIGTVRYPRVVPADDAAAKKLAKRTLTNLYNERPTWLDLAHKRLDEAVFDAYGWPADLPDDGLLSRLLALNLERTESA